jgi:hypothetical protein
MVVEAMTERGLDPKGKSIDEVRRIRDEIEKRVREIAQE